MPDKPHSINRALRIMDEWLELPAEYYKPDLYWFAWKLPPAEVLEAVEIARAKKPDGGIEGFKYFCGICWRKIEKRKLLLSWN